MLPPKSQYQVQKTVVPTKNHGKDKVDSNADKVKNAKGRVVRFRSICEEFDVTPSRESSPVCEIEREDLPGGSALFQQILKEFHTSDESSEESIFSETERPSSSPSRSPKKPILKRRQVSKLCRQKRKTKK